MNTSKKMEDEIISLASTIKRNMVGPAGQRLDDLECRILKNERAIAFLGRAFFAAGVILAAAMGAMIYYLSTG